MWLEAKAFPLTPARVAGEKGAGACGGDASGDAVCEHRSMIPHATASSAFMK
jgi:hypothetical protein